MSTVLDQTQVTERVPEVTAPDDTDAAKMSQKLQDLQTATQTLVRTESTAEIARITVETARDVLDCPITGMWLYNEETDRLEPAAVTDEGRDLLGEPVGFARGESLAWKAFETGEIGTYQTLREVPGVFNPETAVQSEIDLPVGRHGVITTATTRQAAFDDTDIDLLRILAANTEAVLDRTAREREIERQNERLNEFASIISHDVRNPLAIAQGYLDLARDDCETTHHDTIDRALDRVEALTTDLLTLARQGETVATLEPVALATVVDDCWQMIDTADARLTVETDLVLEADESRLRQLLENLLRNAVEHGGEDVTVTVGALPNGFYVEDDGPGIPPERRELVFEGGYSTAHEGTGLGLRIIKQITHAHDWDLTVTESEAGGARFEITGACTARSGS